MIQLYSKGTTDFSKRGIAIQAQRAEVSFQDNGRFDLDVTVPAEGNTITFDYGQVIRCPVPPQHIDRIKLGKYSYYQVSSGLSDVPLYVTVPRSERVAYSQWVYGQEYASGSKVTYDGRNYRAITDITGVATIGVPPVLPNGWTQIASMVTVGGEIAETLDAGDIVMKTGDFNSTYMEAATLSGKTGFIEIAKCTNQGSSENVYVEAQDITEQSFIITEIEKIQSGKAIYLHAEHISYQLGRVILGDCNVTRANPATALMFVRGAMKEEYPGNLYTNIREQYVTGNWSWKNAQSAILDPKDGILQATSGQLIRNDLDYFVINKSEANARYTVTYGTNQKSVKWKGDVGEIVTRIWPIAQTADGETLNLPEGHIDTVRDIPFMRPQTLDTKLKVGQKEKQTDGTEVELTEDMIFERMREAANNRFNIDECDKPDITLEVDWVHLPETEEYKELYALRNAAPGEWVLVKNGPLDISVTIQLTGYTWDAILNRYIKCTFGKNKAGGTVASYDLKSNSVSGRTLQSGSVSGNAMQAGSITTRELAANSITAEKIASRSIESQLIKAEAITADEIAASAVSAEKIAAGAVTTQKLDAEAITAEKIAAGAITTVKLSANAVTAEKINAEAVTAEKIKANAVTAEKINAEAVTAEKIKANAVTAEKIKADAVTAEKIKANAVTADKINAGAVTAQKIASQAITTEKLDAGAVTAGKIAANAITSEKIDAGAVTAQKIAALAITSDKIAAQAITTDKLDANAVTAGKIAANAITSEKIDAYAIVAGKIASGAITSEKIEAGAVTAVKIDAGAVTTEKLDAGAVTTGKLAAGAVTANIIASDAVTSDKILAGAVTTGKLDAGAVTAGKIAANAITTEKIAAGAVTANEIASGSITATKIDTTDLQAIHAALGTATIVTAAIQSADISYLQVKDLNAESAWFGQAIIQEGVAGKLFIPRLSVVYAQIVAATISDLVIQASNDNFYKLDVAADGQVTATQVSVSASEIESGHTTDGRTIYLGTDIVAEDLNTTNIYATHALMDEINAAVINVDELFAKDATIQALNVVDLSSNTYIRSTIGNWNSGSTITQTIGSLESRIAGLGHSNIYYSATEPSHENLVVGDIWIKPTSNNNWGDVKTQTWGYYKQNMNWIGVYGVYAMYTWNGEIWRLLYDSQVNIMLETEIQQTNALVALKANQSDLDTIGGTVSTLSAELTVQAGRINSTVEAVNAKSTSYYGDTDPSASHTMHIGDIWYRGYDTITTWGSLKNNFTWRTLKENKWKDALGGESYIWNGSGWIITSDRGSEIAQRTMIDQTNTEIRLMATEQATIRGEVYENRAQITITAAQIESEVSRAKNAETTISTRVTQTAESISAEVQRANTAEGILRASIQANAESIALEVTRATGAEGTLSGQIVAKANEVKLSVSNGETAAGKVLTSGSYISIQLDSITLASGGKIVLQSGATISMSATQIHLSASETLEDRLETIESSITEPGNDTTTEYRLSTSNSSATGGNYSWQATIPQTIPAAPYIWSRKKIVGSSGTTYETAVLEVGLSSATYYTHLKYAAGSSNQTAPQSGWTKEIPVTTTQNPYIWVQVLSVTTGGNETVVSTYFDSTLTSMDSGAIVAKNIANGTTSVPKVSSTGITIDGNAINITSTGTLTVAANGKVDFKNASGNNMIRMDSSGIQIASGASIAIASGGSITIDAGATVSLSASQISFTSSQSLSGKISDMDTATSNADTKATNAGTAASNAASAASTADTKATNAQTAANNIANGTTAVPKVTATGFTVDGNSVSVTSTGTLTVATNGKISITNAEGNGTAVTIDKKGIEIHTGGKLICTASQINLTAEQTLSGKLTEMDTATTNAQTDATNAGTAASNAATAASNAQSTADGAVTSIGNITNGTTAVKYVDTTGVSIKDDKISIKSSGKIEIAANGKISVATGGVFDLVASNLVCSSQKDYMAVVDSYNNGTQYRGWKMSKKTIYAFDVLAEYYDLNHDNMTKCVGMTIPTSSDGISIWTGAASSPSDAPFRVSYSGRVTTLDYIRVRDIVENETTHEFEEDTKVILRPTGVCTAVQWATYSSRDVKHDIRPLSYDDSVIDRLQPVSFIYNKDREQLTRYGLIYEDTVDLLPVICSDTEDGKSISYVELVPVLLKEIQSLRSRVRTLEEAA